MYRPNFCCECGARILLLHWHFWTSRKFCRECSKRLLKQRLKVPFAASIVLFSLGMIMGRARRPASPPLIIERSANSPLSDSAIKTKTDLNSAGAKPGSSTSSDSQSTTNEELIYICGARTKKGTPCSRRVLSPVRCWQHKGDPAMLPPEKLKVSG